MIKNVLVTGGAGFIGSHTVDALIQRGYRVRILDNLCAQVHGADRQRPDYLNPQAEFVQGDVRDRATVQRCLEGIDAVIHDAAMVGVGQSQYQIAEYIDVNVGGTAVLLDVLANEKNQVRKLLVASSMSLYGEGAYSCSQHGRIEPQHRSNAQLARREWATTCPHCQRRLTPIGTDEGKRLSTTSIYAQSKKDQEEYALIFGRTYNIPTVALRYFNVYGPRQSLSNPYTGVAAIFSSRIKNNQSPLIYEDGHQRRDFINVRDIVAAKLLALEDPKLRDCALNVGTGRPTSILELAWALIELYGRDLQPQIVGKYRSGDIRDCYADISLLKAAGYRPSVSLSSGLAELAAWADQRAAEDGVEGAHAELLKHGLVA